MAVLAQHRIGMRTQQSAHGLRHHWHEVLGRSCARHLPAVEDAEICGVAKGVAKTKDRHQKEKGLSNFHR